MSGAGVASSKAALVVVGLVVVAGGAGATYVATGGELPAGIDNPFASEPGLVDTVPEGVDMVVYSDTGFYQDPTTEDLVNGFIDISKENTPFYEGPDDYEEWLEDTQDSADLEASELNSATIYAEYPPEGSFGVGAGSSEEEMYVGVLIDSNWEEDEFVDAAENGTTYDEDEYEGYTVYVEEDVEYGQPTYIGVLDAGQYVVGTEEAVEDAIDVDRGDEDTFDDDLRTAFENTQEGYFRFALTVPTERIPETPESTQSQSPVDLSPFREVDVVSGAYFTREGERVGMSLQLTAGSESDAEDIADVTDGAVSFARGSTSVEEVSDVLDNVEVEQEDSTVSITYESTTEDLLAAYEGLLEQRMGGPGTATRVVPVPSG